MTDATISPFTLRPSQKVILRYRHGRMGISAVPGSGKTWTLSLLAADIIASGRLADDQEILMVTLINSAVDNFYQRVGSFVREKGLLPNVGYRVRTLHGLAHDIVRERPGLVGLADNFQILDEREANSIRNEIAQAWLNSHPGALEDYLDPELDENRRGWVYREKLPDLVKKIALDSISYAKDYQLTPELLHVRLEQLPVPLPLAEMGCEMYGNYQRALTYRGAVDFDDLIRLALEALKADPLYLERMRYRWPYILEDEAQDSSRLQEQILSKLAGEHGNWVRVGDPNQAIYETFTTANPRYLRHFLVQPGVVRRELPESGRSALSIIRLANYLAEWTHAEHPLADVRDGLSKTPVIIPTQAGDSQPNPLDDPLGIRLDNGKMTPREEIIAVADSLASWLPGHQDWTVAVLVPRNERGKDLVDELIKRGIGHDDSMLVSSSGTRFSAGALGNLLRYLSDPQSAHKLAIAYRVWRRDDRGKDEERVRLERVAELLRKMGHVEDYLWPSPDRDWLVESGLEQADPTAYESLLQFRELIRRWQAAILLPVDQILLTLSQDLLTESSELALAYKLATWLRRASQVNPTWRLPELTEELAAIARNARRFLGFNEADTGFDPNLHRGQVIVATIHKAKGLEWERVYLMSVNNYDFPSGNEYDEYIAERFFVRDHLNLEAEALAQLETALASDEYHWYAEGEATRQARLDYVRERLRLLYVGITRARRELIITWNTGRKGNLQPALPLVALQNYWRQDRDTR